MIDPKLYEYATDAQKIKLEAIDEHGSNRKASIALGLSRQTVDEALKLVKRKAAKQGYAPDSDLTFDVPEGFALQGVSDMRTNADGKPQWLKYNVDKEKQEEVLRAAVAAFASEIPAVAAVQAPKDTSDRYMACYPIGDHHLGMLAWEDEVDENYDLSISEHLLMGAINNLVAAAPDCDRSAVILLGDFMHYDGWNAVTPTNKNPLDADGRFPKMVRAAIRSVRYVIQRALSKHQHVDVIIEIGNHDMAGSIFLMECLHNVYENEPRVTVDTSPSRFHYLMFGSTLVGIHHGDGAKMADLPLIMAHDQPQAWGEAKFRYFWTGHVHHDQVKDIHGTKVESFRILAPNDGWAHGKGYRSMQDMKCVILHKEYGEVARHTVNPEMMK
jgi:hypothetical protein